MNSWAFQAPFLAEGKIVLEEEETEPFPMKMEDQHIAMIAAAYAGRSDVTVDDVVHLVQSLRGDGPVVKAETTVRTEAMVPAVPVERAVTQNRIFCLCCGKGFKMLKRHLGAEHGMTEAEYRATFGLPKEMPLVAPSYSISKAEYARRTGLGTHERGKKVDSPEIS